MFDLFEKHGVSNDFSKENGRVDLIGIPRHSIFYWIFFTCCSERLCHFINVFVADLFCNLNICFVHIIFKIKAMQHISDMNNIVFRYLRGKNHILFKQTAFRTLYLTLGIFRYRAFMFVSRKILFCRWKVQIFIFE